VENRDACGDLAAEPPSEQLEIPPAENAEHLRFAEELADTLNRAQADNGRVDRDSYRPVAAHHRGTLAAALAIKNAGVPLAAATQYVWLEGQKYKPRAGAPTDRLARVSRARLHRVVPRAPREACAAARRGAATAARARAQADRRRRRPRGPAAPGALA
jgi:hypothetical protein